MKRKSLTLILVLLALPAFSGAADEPAWVAKVPDFRSSWPPPPAPGTVAPDFALKDARSGRTISLATACEGQKATLLLFLDENCGTCKQRGKDLADSLAKARAIEGTGVLAIFTRNLVNHGPKAVLAFAEKAGLPSEVPLLLDDTNDTAEVSLEYRISIAPTAVVLDAEGRIAYFGLALDRSGSELLRRIVKSVVDGEELAGPAVRPPFG